jgi:outer membrane receptor protein involved in Fe transport
MGLFRCALVASAVLLISSAANAQTTEETTPKAAEPAPPAAGSSQLPEVEVIQKKATPAPKAAAKKAAPAAKKQPAPAETPAEPTIETEGLASGTVQMSPLAGSELPIGKVPNAVGRATAADIARSGYVQATDVLQQTVPGVILSDAQGNVFQRTLQFRGFDASPLNGAAQGIAVYQNGVRINEAFGDIVNWDFLPSNAIEGITIIGPNPVFGLNAIGGAATVNMRDGFDFQGTEIDLRAGSFGRLQGSLATGGRSGAWGAFLAVEGIQDDGFRDFSESEIRRMYADVGVKTSDAEFHLNFTGAKNEVGVTAAAPVQLLDLGWERTFTSPQTTDNDLAMVSFNGAVKATSTLTLSGLAYYRMFKQKHLDGNIVEAVDCDGAGPGDELCLEEDGALEEAEDINGDGIDFDPALRYGSLDRTSQDADGYGSTLQAVEKSPLFGLPNQFLIGASYDHGKVKYGASSELGFFGPKFVVNSFTDPFILAEPDDFAARSLTTKNDYVGVFFSDTIDLTSRLAVTVGGRYNYARIELKNEAELEPGDEDFLSGTHTFERFNPMAGATYTLLPGLTLFGSYAEANRAPTPAELACADPENPCLIESFLTADPPLEQVVSKTYELGLRGEILSWSHDRRLEWTLGAFHGTNEDDIIPIAAPISGRGFFQNAGDTQRQGIEAGVQYHDTRWMSYANYAFIDATFQTPLIVASPDSPNAAAFNCEDGPPGPPADPDEAVCIQVSKGDRIPGIPQHRFKAGFEYWITPKWKFGSDLVAASNQVFFGDEGNDGKKLGGYATVDLHTSYDVTEHFQIYGLVDNVFDTRYGLFGNYFNRELANAAGEADGLPADFFTDARTITPAPPVTAYGGVKFRF